MQKVRGSNPLSSTDLSDLCSNLKWQAAARWLLPAGTELSKAARDLLAALKTDPPRKVHQLSTPET
jgi:hypothetical protein